MDETLNDFGGDWKKFIDFKEGNDNISRFNLKKSLDAVHSKVCKNGLSLLCIDTLVSVLEKLRETNDDAELSLEVLKNLIPNERLTNELGHRLLSWFLLSNHTTTSATSYFTYWLLVSVKVGVVSKELIQKNYFKPLVFSFLRNVSNDALSHLLKLLSNKDNVSSNLFRQVVVLYNQQEDANKKRQLAVLLKYYFQICENHQDLKCKKVVSPSVLTLKNKSLEKVIDRIIEINSEKNSKLTFTKVVGSLNNEETKVEKDYYFGLSPTYNSASKGVQLSLLTNFQDVIKHYEHIVPPTNILAVLQSKCGHLYVRFSSPDWVANLEEQVKLILNGILNNCLHPNIIDDKFLNALVGVQSVCCESLLAVSDFLKSYLIKWDTVQFRDEIVQLIPWLYFTSSSDLRSTMANLFTIFTTAEINCRLLLLNSLFTLYVNLLIYVNKRVPSGSPPVRYKPSNWMKNKPEDFFSLYIEILEKFVQTGLLFHGSSSVFLSQTIVGYHEIYAAQKMFNFKILNDNSSLNLTVLPISVVLMSHTSTSVTIFTCLLMALSTYWEDQEFILSKLNEQLLDDYYRTFQFIEKYTADTVKLLFRGMDRDDLEDSLIFQMMKKSDKESYLKMFSSMRGLLSFTKHFATSHIAYELTKKMKINLSSIQPEKYLDLLEYFAPKISSIMTRLSLNLDERAASREANGENSGPSCN